MSLKTKGIKRTAISEPGDTEEQDRDPDLDNAPLHSQTDVIRSSSQTMPGEIPASLPIHQSDEIIERQERLARNRQKARIRRERKRLSTETMIGYIRELQSCNDDLRKKNQVLCHGLEKYGVIYSGVPTSTANQTTSTLDTTSTGSLQHMLQQQPAVMQGNAIRIASNGLTNINSQPLQNEGNGASTPLSWPASIHDTLISCASPLQQANQQRLQQGAAAHSLLLEMIRQPSTHLMQALNHHAPHMPGIGGTFIEGSNQSFLPSNTIANMENKEHQYQQQQQQQQGSNVCIVKGNIL